jgi:methoxymalonate biosynthesis protein
MNPPVPLVKCLVWDLDNTLWRGTLSEDLHVRVDPAISETISALDARGILQSVASKNDHDLAWARLQEFGLSDYFLLPHIGWGPKSDSIRRIAERLNLGLTAMAFIDDQPVECAEVGFHLPDVRCYTADLASALPDLPEFSPRVVTTDARRRRDMYRSGFERDAARESFTGPDAEFLRSLELELRINRADETDLSRVEELTMRTSQMNATGIHYSAQALLEMRTDATHDVLVAALTDRFGAHGYVAVSLLDKCDGYWHLKLLAASCRVVTFGVGAAILNWLVDQAARAGMHIVADFRATPRNRMMEIAYRFAGFTELATANCRCCAVAAKPNEIQRFHLIPEPRPEPETMRLVAPDLSEPSPAAISCGPR